MESADALLRGLAHGDTVLESHPESAMKRDQDSTDDFEHLEGEGKQEAGESPLHQHRSATQSFLDMERSPAAEPPRAPSVTDKLVDHIADKFTDSESDADTAGESPLHRPAPSAPSAPSPEPPALPARDPTSVLAPTSVHVPVPAPSSVSAATPAPAPVSAEIPAPASIPTEKPAPTPLPIVTPAPSIVEKQEKPEVKPVASAPAPKPEPELKPKPVEREPVVAPRSPTAHVIEAEVIFCQMGLGEYAHTLFIYTT